MRQIIQKPHKYSPIPIFYPSYALANSDPPQVLDQHLFLRNEWSNLLARIPTRNRTGSLYIHSPNYYLNHQTRLLNVHFYSSILPIIFVIMTIRVAHYLGDFHNISESIQCTSKQNCNTSLHCNNTNHMSTRIKILADKENKTMHWKKEIRTTLEETKN